VLLVVEALYMCVCGIPDYLFIYLFDSAFVKILMVERQFLDQSFLKFYVGNWF
jgi:hypothetical protein